MLKTVLIAFSTIFIAELGDKTQLAVLALKSKGISGLGIFTGSMIAFAILTGMAIFLGDWLNANIPINIIQKVASVSFVVIGLLMWFDKV